eukprot:6462-Heterococcus_DN1.PRE.2
MARLLSSLTARSSRNRMPRATAVSRTCCDAAATTATVSVSASLLLLLLLVLSLCICSNCAAVTAGRSSCMRALRNVFLQRRAAAMASVNVAVRQQCWS